MTIDFGWHPQDIRIILSAGQEFVLEIAPTDLTAIPDDATSSIKLYPPGTEVLPIASWPTPLDSWDATISGGVVSWQISSSRADLIPNLAFARVLLTYPDGEPYTWARGPVSRDD